MTELEARRTSTVDARAHKPAVIVGLEANGLGVARALAQHGIRCIGVGKPQWEPAYASRHCTIVRCPEWSAEALVDTLVALGATLPDKTPLLITKDEPVLWISAHRARLCERYAIDLPAEDTVNLLMSKARFGALAAAEGWPMPKTLTIADRAGLLSILDDVPFPCIVKPALKNSAFRAHAPQKAFRASRPEELVSAYDAFSQWEREAIIQEWIEGGDERIAYCLAYYGKNGDPLALFSGRKLRQRPAGCGNTVIAAPAPEAWRTKMEDLTRRVFGRVNYRGLGSLELKVRADDSLVIMEPTVGRTNWQSEVAVINGTNIPAIAYFDLVGAPSAPAARSVPARKLVDGGAERKDLYELRRRADLTLSRWLTDRSGKKRYMLWRASDPGPALAAAAHLLLRTMRYALRAPRKLLSRLGRAYYGVRGRSIESDERECSADRMSASMHADAPASILHVIDTGGPGGAETVFAEIAARRGAAALEPVAIVPREGWLATRLRERGLVPEIVPSVGAMNFSYLTRLAAIARARDVRLIHAHLLGATVYAAMLGLALRIPVIGVFHGPSDVAGPQRLKRLKRCILRRGCTAIVAVSKSTQEALIRYGIDAHDIRLIPNGVDTDRFFPERESALRRELGLAPHEYLIGAVGNIRGPKDYETLIRSARVVADARRECHFGVVGEGTEDDMRRLLTLRDSLGLADRFHFLGFRQADRALFSDFDLFVSSSSSEGLPLSFLEAMACGVCVVATESGGAQEVVEHERTGLLAPVRNPEALGTAMLRALEDDDLRARLAAMGRARVTREFSLEATIARYGSLYAGILNPADTDVNDRSRERSGS